MLRFILPYPLRPDNPIVKNPISLFVWIHTVPPRTRKHIRGNAGKAAIGSIIGALNSMATEKGMVICSRGSSAAEQYADREGIRFEVMD